MYRAHRARQGGVSLIELMIGMVLGLVILGAVLYVFAGNRASYRHQESLSMVQETGRFALELLSRDLRMAGYAGCGNTAFLEFLSGAFGNANAIGGATGATVDDPDNVVVWQGVRRDGTGIARVTGQPSDVQLDVEDAGQLGGVPDRIIVTDCAYAEVVDLAAIAGNTLNIAGGTPLVRTYGAGAQVIPFETVAFAVNTATNTLTRNAQPIAEGVTNLKLFYGIGTGSDRTADDYVATPATAADWQRVVAVRINLDVQNGEIELPFSTTVTLRNRVP